MADKDPIWKYLVVMFVCAIPLVIVEMTLGPDSPVKFVAGIPLIVATFATCDRVTGRKINGR